MTQLAYQVPGDRRAKTILRIPESHTLYLCPNACGRRQGIRALKNGQADHASFLSFSQADIALGDYVDMVQCAVDEVLAAVEPTPRALTLYVNCIDDFLGTDAPALLADLAARHPATRFMLSHINPIAADVQRSLVAQGIQENLYAPLNPVAPEMRDRGLNVVGAFVSVPAASEFHRVAAALGVCEVRDLVSCATFADYGRLAQSALNLSLSSLGDAACAAMERRLGIAWMAWHACYDLDEIDRRYDELARLYGRPRPDTADARAAAEAAVGRARIAVGQTPVVVDTSASLMPFSLALALLKGGFNVCAVFALHAKGFDADAEEVLARDYPAVQVARTQGLDAFARFGGARDCLAVGRDAGFLLRAAHMADVYHDEGYFGFQGVARLMDDIARAARTTAEWEV